MAKKKATKKTPASKAPKTTTKASRKIIKPALSDKEQKLLERQKLIQKQDDVTLEKCNCKENQRVDVKDIYIKQLTSSQLEVTEVRGKMRVSETVTKGGTSMYAFGRGYDELAKMAAKSKGLWSICNCKTIGKKGSIAKSKKS